MRVTMTVFISGTRNGEPWPPVGGSCDLPADEAADMIAAGYAEPARSAAPSEVADAPPVGEKADATPAKPRGRTRKAQA